ncbi:MAG: hypothetical protein ACFFCS_10995 [Candidatus Hodarchaeota archaeon]
MDEDTKEKQDQVKLQTYVAGEDKEKYIFLKEKLTAGASIPDSQVLKLIINRLHALETNPNVFDGSYLMTYTRHLERQLRAIHKELHAPSADKEEDFG